MRSEFVTHPLRFLLAGALSITAGEIVAGQSIAKPQGTVIGRNPLGPNTDALQQKPFDVLCRGGAWLRVDPAGRRHAAFFQFGKTLPGPHGAGLQPGECSPVDRLFRLDEPPGIQFDDKGGEESVVGHRADSNRYWRFAVIKTSYGYFDARSYQRVLVVAEQRAPAVDAVKKAETAKGTEAAQKTADAPPKNAELKPADRVLPNPAEKAGLNPQPLPPKPAEIVQQPAPRVVPAPVDKAVAKPAEKPAERVMAVPSPPPPLPSPARVTPATPIAGRAPAGPGGEILQQKPVEILCRGGSDLRVDRLSAPATQAGAVTMGVFFLPPNVAAGALGSRLPPGTCSFRGNQVFGPSDPGGIYFEAAANARAKPMLSGSVGPLATAAERFPDAETIQAYLEDSSHYWRFTAVNTHRGHFQATAHEYWKAGPVLGESDVARDRAGALAIGRITDVRVTSRDRSVRLEFTAAPDATPVILIVKGPAKVDESTGAVLFWDTGAPMALNAQREANTSSPTVTRYVADSQVHRAPIGDNLSLLEPGVQYHYTISDRYDTSRRTAGTFTTLAPDAAGASAPAAASGTPTSRSAIEDRGIIIVGGRDEPPGAAAKAEAEPRAPRVTPEDIDKGLGSRSVGQAVVRPAEKIDLNLQQLSPGGARSLFGMDDRAIIIVGGKKMTAGEAKRQIQGELQRETGSTRTFSVSRSGPGVLPNADTPLLDLPGRLTQRGQPIGAAAAGASRAAALKMECTANPPRISNIQGRITPGGRFTINGMCFGDQAGSVEIIGQFAGGNLKPPFLAWTDSAIVVEMPAVTDVAGHTTAISVRRSDHKVSAARQAQFFAAVRLVDVPSEMWSPTGLFFSFDSARVSGDAISGYTSFTGAPEQRTTGFRVTVNPSCRLETLDVPATIGQVKIVSGWENGAPHEANVQIVWSPACRIHRMDYVVATQEEKFCSGAFELKARASCPVGIGVQ